jgi:dienelactone hydrolase
MQTTQRRTIGLVAALLGAGAALVTGAGAAQAVPAVPLEDPGPLTVMQWDAGMVAAGGGTTAVPVLVYYPAGAPGPFPVVEVVHGFARNGSFHVVLANDLASRGAVVVVPDMPCGLAGCDYDVEATAVSDLLDWITTQGGTAASPVAGIVDGGRRGVIGHSAGGRAVFLAAARDPSIDVVVGFDPVDTSGAVVAEVGALAVPSVALMAAMDSTCNVNRDWEVSIFPATPAPSAMWEVTGAGHCEPEDPTDGVCELVCGAGDRAAAPIFRRYAVAWTMCLLGVDPSAGAWVNGTGVSDDVAAGLIGTPTENGTAALDCTGPPPGGSDAGTDGGGAGGSDAAGSPDGGTPADAASADADAGAGGGGGGCHCAAIAPGAPGRAGAAAPAAVLALLALLLRGRRHHLDDGEHRALRIP